MNHCKYCEKPTKNDKFCSRSCSAKVSNLIPKRKNGPSAVPRNCVACGTSYFLKESKSHFCKTCKFNRAEFHKTSKATLRYYAERCQKKGIHRSWWFSEVRSLCRIWNASRPKICNVCGYDKHIEYAHIKPISEFDLDTPLFIVNAEENVAILCRNHHWELDHGLLFL